MEENKIKCSIKINLLSYTNIRQMYYYVLPLELFETLG